MYTRIINTLYDVRILCTSHKQFYLSRYIFYSVYVKLNKLTIDTTEYRHYVTRHTHERTT